MWKFTGNSPEFSPEFSPLFFSQVFACFVLASAQRFVPAFCLHLVLALRPRVSPRRFVLALRPGVSSQPRSSASSQRFVAALFPRFVPSVCLGLVAASPEGLWPCNGGGARGRGRAWTRHGEAENVRPLKQSFLRGRAKAKPTNQDQGQRGQYQKLYRFQGIKELSNARNDYIRRTQTR